MYLPPIIELIHAAWKVAGLSPHQAIDGNIPYSWLLRFRTLMWYMESLGASPRFKEDNVRQDQSGILERMIG